MITRRELIKKSAWVAAVVAVPPVLATQVSEPFSGYVIKPSGIPAIDLGAVETLTLRGWSGELKIMGAGDILIGPQFTGDITLNAKEGGGGVEVVLNHIAEETS